MKIQNLAKIAIAAVMSQTLATAAIAEEYPSEPISIVAVWPAGGTHDVAGRLVAKHLSDKLSVPVVVNNITGAGGSTGMRAIAKAKKDGYTIGVMGMHAISASFMNPNAPALDDIQPIAYIGPEPGALQVTLGSGIESQDEFIDILKKKPGSIVNGNDAPGGNSYIFASVLESSLGVKMTRIPYLGHAPSAAALMSGEVMSTTLPIPATVEQTKAGKVRTLGVMAEQRHHLLPDVPTFKEQGHDVVIGDFYMLVTPKGIPEDRLKKLDSVLQDILQSEEFQKKAYETGFVLDPKGLAEAESILDRETKRIYEILDEEGLIKVPMK